MVDSIEFRTGEFDTVGELSQAVLSNDERAIEVPSTAHTEMKGFLQKMLDSEGWGDEYVLSLGRENPAYFLVLNTELFEHYGTFVFFDEPMDGVYFTTGSSAINLVVEILMKFEGIKIEGSSSIASRAKGAVDYMEADMVFPDSGFKVERTQKELETDEDTEREESEK